jgi:hypothetical protein
MTRSKNMFGESSISQAELLSRYERLCDAWNRAAGAGDHKKRRNCPHDSGERMYAQINVNGSTYYFDGCTQCGKPSKPGQWHPHLTVNTEEAVVIRDMRVANPPCQVCGGWGTELHHWAPKEIFGPVEADHWPTGYLCRECHERWHARIDNHHDNAGRPFE